MNRAITIVTGGRASRLTFAAGLAFAYQDSGYEAALTDGNLDAPFFMPAGAAVARECSTDRNAAHAQLVDRAGSAA